MYKNILVCLDGSPQDQYVSQSAFWMAERLGATLHAFHVIDQLALEGPLLYDISGSLSFGPQMNFLEETRKVMQARAEIILSDFQKACEERHIPFKTHIEESVVHHAIVERSDLHDLTLLGRRGLNYKLDKDLMGSTTDRVIRRIQSPVMVVTHDFTDIHSPLLAFDGSHNAREAMISAVRLLSDLKLPLTVLYVGSNEEEAKEVLAQAKEYLEAYPIPVKYEWQKGSARQEVPEYAKRHRHDLLIVGARGHRGVLDLLLGSTTEYSLWQGFAHVFIDR